MEYRGWTIERVSSGRKTHHWEGRRFGVRVKTRTVGGLFTVINARAAHEQEVRRGLVRIA